MGNDECTDRLRGPNAARGVLMRHNISKVWNSFRTSLSCCMTRVLSRISIVLGWSSSPLRITEGQVSTYPLETPVACVIEVAIALCDDLHRFRDISLFSLS